MPLNTLLKNKLYILYVCITVYYMYLGFAKSGSVYMLRINETSNSYLINTLYSIIFRHL